METQRNSFRRFLERGIGEELLAISKIHGDRAQRVHKQKLKKLQKPQKRQKPSKPQKPL